MPVNESEERLAGFTKKTFLSMWSHNNLFYKIGKEFCDVMVVFGNDVIIMSDKLIRYNQDIEESIAWRRWYSSAIEGSVKQLNGAYKHIKEFPGNLYTDAQATVHSSIELPPQDVMRIHLIAVANGCAEACRKKYGHFGLKFNTGCSTTDMPFTIGIQKKEFIHFFNEHSLCALFLCLDTTKDFIDYLQARKELLLTQDKRIEINGEEELLASWMLSQPGDSSFYMPYESFCTTKDSYVIGTGFWEKYNSDDNKTIREFFRRGSYIIDDLIEHIYSEYNNENLVIGQGESVNYHEQAFRFLASESRLGRQLISQPLLDIMHENPDYFWANIVESHDNPGLLYVWLIYPKLPEKFSDEKVENILLIHLSKYLLVAQAKFRGAKTIFGACLPNAASRDNIRLFIINDGAYWNEEIKVHAEKLELEEGILNNIKSTRSCTIRI
ncbi:hypothetical protein [Serratia proteamaculans]|uniref:hypothetical protein n=1 Tax=Serratia proteamaculans TaxID=28151 RepID=UPI001F3A338D|nr:hypothetical protein [Serratia proteamaculans]MDW5508482.1 hypothetical protein [Serratia proteamaculans]